MAVETSNGLEKPAGLSTAGEKAYEVIMSLVANQESFCTGGCKAFYSPSEWRARGEYYGLSSHLIVVHDGGDFAPMFNPNYLQYSAHAEMQEALSKVGLYAEACTCWYSAIYNIAK